MRQQVRRLPRGRGPRWPGRSSRPAAVAGRQPGRARGGAGGGAVMSRPAGLRRFVSDLPESPLGGPPAEGPGAVPEGGRAGAPQNEEKCEFCAAGIPAEHGHVADLEQSSLMWACRACYLLFTHGQAARGRYRSVPDRYLVDPARPMTAAEWDALEIPVGLAFFLHSSAVGQVTGFYPSPAGATECRLDLAAWDRLAADHPLLATMAPDVEAALICRAAGSDPAAPRSASSDPAAPPKDSVEHFLVPI